MSASTTPPFGDFVQPFQVEALGLRGRLVRISDVATASAGGGRYPDDVARLLAATLALGAALAGGLKYEGLFTLQAQGNGPVGLLMADLSSDGDVRGYARFDAERLAAAAPESDDVPRLLGAGHLAFTVDQGPDTDRYQGITELTGATLAECAQNYFRQSEQLETAIVLGAGAADEGALRSAAFVVQKMPDDGAVEDPEDAWREAAILTSTLAVSELLDPGLGATDILYRLFHERGVRVFETKPLRHACRCSQDRVERTLKSFPRDEIDEMRVDGKIIVTCEFCGTDYVFDDAGLDRLFS
ncbi:MAG: Hsp33 family molecular chaperone HslO [Magnetovibrio sp.]|nr:Hsp33 family molecular chaperone HslO [Magnetovibrio sp.]